MHETLTLVSSRRELLDLIESQYIQEEITFLTIRIRHVIHIATSLSYLLCPLMLNADEESTSSSMFTTNEKKPRRTQISTFPSYQPKLQIVKSKPREQSTTYNNTIPCIKLLRLTRIEVLTVIGDYMQALISDTRRFLSMTFYLAVNPHLLVNL